MRRVRTWSAWTVAVGAVLTWNAVARSQVIVNGQHASDNASAGSIALRSPGTMVIAGIVRAQKAVDLTRRGIEIVETTSPMSPRATFLVDAIKIIFDQLNSTLLYLGNILLQRAGLPPLSPQVTPPTTTVDENADGESTGDVSVDEVRGPGGRK